MASKTAKNGVYRDVIRSLESKLEEQGKELQQARKMNAKAVPVIAYYSDPRNWKTQCHPDTGIPLKNIDFDNGIRARQLQSAMM